MCWLAAAAYRNYDANQIFSSSFRLRGPVFVDCEQRTWRGSIVVWPCAAMDSVQHCRNYPELRTPRLSTACTRQTLQPRRVQQQVCNSSTPNKARENLQHLAQKFTALTLSGLCVVGGMCRCAVFLIALYLLLISCVAYAGASARLEGVNKPDLLPKEFSTVIDVAGFLTDGEVSKMLAYLLQWCQCMH